MESSIVATIAGVSTEAKQDTQITSLQLLDNPIDCGVHRTIDLDESEEEVKATPGSVYGMMFYNAHATDVRYLKFYNATAANVTVGTTVPVLTIPLPAGQWTGITLPFGWALDTAICIAATTGVADNDSGAPGANEVIGAVFFK